MSLQDETGVFHEFDPPEADDPHRFEPSDVKEEEVWSRYRSWLEGLQVNTPGAGCSLELCA